jgi:Mg2+/Co2+ transporter CorB
MSGDINISLFLGFLFFLLLCSAFFSGSETGMMSLNRYRLRHLARKKHIAATRVNKLLERTDRLLSAILIGNTLTNVMASAIVTMIATRYFNEAGILLVSFLFTLVVLIFAEIIPKTLAALYPQKFAFAASLPLKFLLKLFSPFVKMATLIMRGVLHLLKAKGHEAHPDALTTEELRTVVNEATDKITPAYQTMLLRILDLENITVEDVMIPKSEIKGIDLSQPWQAVLKQLETIHYARLPLYFEQLDQVQGFLHTKKLNLTSKEELSKQSLLSNSEKVFFIPENTPINIQLSHFQKQKYRIGMVVDEYGEIQGLVTLEDILEEIVGEFTTSQMNLDRQIRDNKDGSFTVDGGINVRELNRSLGFNLPTAGPKTLSGLIVETLQSLPGKGISLRIGQYRIEIISVKDKMVEKAMIHFDKQQLKSKDTDQK